MVDQKMSTIHNNPGLVYIVNNHMLGHLNPNTIQLLNQYIMACFATHLFVFDVASQRVIQNFHLPHQAHILCARYFLQTNGVKIVSFDMEGTIVQASFGQEGQGKGYKMKEVRKLGKGDKISAISGVFISDNTILYTSSSHNPHLLNLSTPTDPQPVLPPQLTQKLWHTSTHTFLLSSENPKKISIFHNETKAIIKQYMHTCAITAATNLDDSLVIGDQRGKIIIQYAGLAENKAKGKSKKGVATVLEWHTGPVLVLCAYGRYLYSAGEESVVVLWHTRDLSRDFLPRIGTAITSLAVQPETNEIICGLSDNSIKMLDISKDKQTRTFKTILNPQGYAPTAQPRFNISTTSYNNGVVCLNSVPGKVQFINLYKNLENTEFEIVPRNLVNAINKDIVAPHRIVNSVFSCDWMYSCFVVRREQQSYLKFYRKSACGLELLNKIESPHKSATNQCVYVTYKDKHRFVTCSFQDDTVRVWNEHCQRKKSILDVNEVYWRCSQEIGFRGLKPTSLVSLGLYIAIVYANRELVLYELDSKGIFVVMGHKSVNLNIEQAKIIEVEHAKDKHQIKIFVKTTNTYELWNCIKDKNHNLTISISQKISPKNKIVNSFMLVGPKQSALVLNQEKGTELIMIDNKTNKYVEAYSSDGPIDSAFWLNSRLILIGADLMLTALDGQEFIKFEAVESDSPKIIQSEQTDMITGETNIFKLNEKWVERQTIGNKQKVSDCTSDLHLLPDCISMWSQMADRLLL